MAQIRVGIGGWTFAPWRDNFFPAKWPHAKELEFASRHVTTIEVNGTFYRTQAPDTFRRWAAETPDDFVFALKAHRVATNRKVLAEAGPSIERFLTSGPLELGSKLGPILWQLAPTKQFDAADLEAFLALLPQTMDGRALRHVLEVRHESFKSAAFIDLARRYKVAVCIAHSASYPQIADVTADFVYARLQSSAADETTGYSPPALAAWAKQARRWSSGDTDDDLDWVGPRPTAEKTARDCFVFFISGAKERNPAAAMALLAKLGEQGS